jgi:PHD/YefM family antitoxin component YafN of YafNO toxin-antitoxin module
MYWLACIFRDLRHPHVAQGRNAAGGGNHPAMHHLPNLSILGKVGHSYQETAMTALQIKDASPLDQLPVAPASSVKKNGWRGMMRALSTEGRLLVTNHNHPEAVILSTAEYTKLVKAAAAAEQAAPNPLVELRRKFDERLSVLDAPDAGDRLRELIQSPAPLDGQVKAGATF